VCVIDYEVLRGRQNEQVVREVSVAAENVIEIFHFKSPYPITAHGSVENGLSWADGQLYYDKLQKPYARLSQDTRICTRMAPQRPNFSQPCWDSLNEI
jgi:hypothetical protein